MAFTSKDKLARQGFVNSNENTEKTPLSVAASMILKSYGFTATGSHRKRLPKKTKPTQIQRPKHQRGKKFPRLHSSAISKFFDNKPISPSEQVACAVLKRHLDRLTAEVFSAKSARKKWRRRLKNELLSQRFTIKGKVLEVVMKRWMSKVDIATAPSMCENKETEGPLTSVESHPPVSES